MKTNSENCIAIFNEIMVSAYIYVLLPMSEYNGPVNREKMGMILLGIVLTTVLINLGVVVSRALILLKTKAL